MLKRQILACMFTVLGLMFIGPSSAATLSFSPSSTTVGLGDTFDVDIVISDLFDDFTQTQTLVGAFDIYVNYDPSIISSTGVLFSGALGDPADIFETFNLFDISLVPGQVNAFNLSLFDQAVQADLDALSALQATPSFTLATLSFKALQTIGTSPLEFDPLLTLISQEFPIPLDTDFNTGQVSVVPLPGAVWLMLTGLLGIGAMARRRKVAA